VEVKVVEAVVEAAVEAVAEAAAEAVAVSQLVALLVALDQEALQAQHGQVVSAPAEHLNQQLHMEMEEALQALYHLVRFLQAVPKVAELEAK